MGYSYKEILDSGSKVSHVSNSVMPILLGLDDTNTTLVGTVKPHLLKIMMSLHYWKHDIESPFKKHAVEFSVQKTINIHLEVGDHFQCWTNQ